jgi:hypothetical protein
VKLENSKVAAARGRYARLCQGLAHLGFISQGSVQDRTMRKGGGAGYQWTRKVAQKTVTVSLTAEQFNRLKEAVGNYRQLRKQLAEMERLSRKIIFHEAPHRARRKRLPAKVLGVN